MPRHKYFDAGHSISGAVEFLRRELRQGDVVLVKGRNNQKLGRIPLALAGMKVECRCLACGLRRIRCQECPRLSAEASQPPDQ